MEVGKVQDVNAPSITLKALDKRMKSFKATELGLAKVHKLSPSKIENLRDQFVPKIIGLGIFHGKLESPFQQLKLKYLSEFIENSNHPIAIYWDCISEMVPRIKEFYFPQPNLDKDGLIAAMLLDGAFLIQIFRDYTKCLSDNYFSRIENFIPHHIMGNMRNDLLMIENQIPFFVLHELFAIQEGDRYNALNELKKISMKFFGFESSDVSLSVHEHELSDVSLFAGGESIPEHILELFYTTYTNTSIGTTHMSEDRLSARHKQIWNREKSKTIPPARKLEEFGVKFEKHAGGDHVTVWFSDRKLRLPSLEIDDFARCFLANLVMYEEFSPYPKHISSLCYLLNCLMHSEEDVLILSKKGVIDNVSGKDKDVVDFFSAVCMEVEIVPENSLKTVFAGINDYYESEPTRWWGALKREYFRWPWSSFIFGYGFLSAGLAIAGFILQLLKFLQNK